jgi:hypothetical protein
VIITIMPEMKLANLFPEHSKERINKSLIDCGTVLDAAISLSGM